MLLLTQILSVIFDRIVKNVLCAPLKIVRWVRLKLLRASRQQVEKNLATMSEAHSINARHKDIINDIAYNFYGNRMATCGSNRVVKVWNEDEHDKWCLIASWKAHSGSVWKVTWAHPEFGQILATCSFDRTVSVWEEVEKLGPGARGKKHWVRRANLVDSSTFITDLKFAPRHLGFLLATCCADGMIRIYEAPDVMKLSEWTVQHEIRCRLRCSCLAWSTSLSELHPPMIAVGSDETNSSNGGKLFIYEYVANNRRWTRTGTITSVTDAVNDIAFAPHLGRNYHALAIATKNVRIIFIKPLLKSEHSGLSKFEITTIAQFDDHHCAVWRVCWNIMGTILASSGHDGYVRLWKDNSINNWKCVAVIQGDGTFAQSTETDMTTPTSSSNLGNQELSSTSNLAKMSAISHSNQLPWH